MLEPLEPAQLVQFAHPVGVAAVLLAHAGAALLVHLVGVADVAAALSALPALRLAVLVDALLVDAGAALSVRPVGVGRAALVDAVASPQLDGGHGLHPLVALLVHALLAVYLHQNGAGHRHGDHHPHVRVGLTVAAHQSPALPRLPRDVCWEVYRPYKSTP